ncbi:hypothetical protein A2276_02965 [candidate division WOR-1 bacterium RIFOXYA12_FULL_43_27]|uniref:Uncharacterized protein n=1 Tax=candidate division WOR-1 bacterium RIFOXYC2_FULL_46_14 TaxID=1802587 RepID=A0A1F4U7J1_UNCSA|nr:MAG: hypothetical protein A2276_02965 [candidate division WOR-1 bacterium RIFOXYA12_FULL_43_27]OGC19334.1 MAG: hypothetical protein A2292_01370 [candidate division WOR-1 bacterium RIFOXYB2_FULL_46_45]OGC30323.1 MAG: hypothetical protein A2232_01370 [candidate division WOR-1 bacterium RIFOXYA2_FULL_46_56]OGC40924.1 MAG: hypothetical protein A2438_01370 [candidate division WOR-1 bacterium RIFOXYC2_FULL_46_14]
MDRISKDFLFFPPRIFYALHVFKVRFADIGDNRVGGTDNFNQFFHVSRFLDRHFNHGHPMFLSQFQKR